MKKYLKLFALTLIGAISFTACNNELEDSNNKDSGTEKEIKIVAGINGLSRTTSADGSVNTTFVKDDEIGIFVYEGDKAVYSNVKYVYDGSLWNSDNAITAKSGVQYKYYAYYPYNAEVTDAAKVSVTVKADQTGGYNKEDFLTAQNTEAAAGAENITLNFNHAFSLVQVGIKADATTDVNATVILENILPTADVNVITGTVAAATGEVTSVTMKKSATKMEYRAIVPAQTIAENAKLMSITADGKTFAVSNSEAVEYAKGQALQITINKLNALPDGKPIAIIGGSIEKWEEGTDPGDGEVEEIPAERLDLSELNEFDSYETIKAWGSAKVTGTENKWFKRENNTGLVTYTKTEENEISMCLSQGETRATWNNNSIGYHSNLKFDCTKKYKLSFDVKSNESSGSIGVGIANSTDTKLFCKEDLSGTIFTKTINSTYQTVTQTFDFTNCSTSTRGSFADGESYESSTNVDTDNGINIVFYNNTNTGDKGIKTSSTLYIKNIKLEIIK